MNIETVHQCNCCLGNKTLHPLVSAIDLSKANVMQRTIKFDFYTILLLECEGEDFIYGRKYYDYSNATMVFLKPGEIFRMNEAGVLPDKGWLLAFHPDLLYRTSLKNHIRNYTFFSYNKEEALHLSGRETATITCCLENIEEELHHSIDTHTATILSRHIELMLDYCTRFYERQFITRSNVNHDILARFERLLDDYFAGDRAQREGLPSVKWCAGELCLSPNYFGDLIKKETGKSAQEYIQLKLIATAKERILAPDKTIGQVAYELGFQYPQHFTRLFKKITGLTPNEYRSAEHPAS